MGFINNIIYGLRNMFFHDNTSQISRAFGVTLVSSENMKNAIDRWDRISTGHPEWVDSEDNIHTINMAKHIADTRAKLTTLDIGVALSGSPRADAMQPIVDQLVKMLPQQVSEADRLGGMLIRWNGKSWDFIHQGDFGVVEKSDDGGIAGFILASYVTSGNSHYTRLEYHRFEGDIYKISNKAFVSRAVTAAHTTLGNPCPLSKVKKWEHIAPEVELVNIERPLVGFYRVPGANEIDRESPLGCSIFHKAIAELRDIDIAVSRKGLEVEDSKHITFVGQSVVQAAEQKGRKLPRFVQALGISIDDGANKAVQEHAPTLQTDARIKDINFDLSMAGVKCGFSEGVFVLDGQTGMITATQIESDDRDTIQTIKEDRDALRTAVEDALYCLDVMLTLYGEAPIGIYEANYNFGDITYSYEEDKGRWYNYAAQGWVPKWMFLVKFEGYSEEDAKALIAEAQIENRPEPGLFDEE